MADQSQQVSPDTQNAGAAAWAPQAGDPVAIVRDGDQHYQVHASDLPEVKRRLPNSKIVSGPQPHNPDLEAMIAYNKKLQQADEADVPIAATKPGAYQQTKQGEGKLSTAPIRNVNEDPANPFSDTTTSVIGSTGAMMKRDDETNSQFMARAREAGRNVSQTQIDAETASNKKLALPTLGIAEQRDQVCCR